jgi:hypothetical protein
MKANGQDFDALGDVCVRFDSGPPTMLQNHPHLACRVALLGPPTRVRRLGSARFCAEWDLPGRVESLTFGNPWPMDRRNVVGLEVTGAARAAVHSWIVALADAVGIEVNAAHARLAALRSALLVVATR